MPWRKAHGCLRHMVRHRYPLAQLGVGRALVRKSPDQRGPGPLVPPCPAATLGHT